MPIITTQSDNGLVSLNTHRHARVGRWAWPPLKPDLCNSCFDKQLIHFPAEGYIQRKKRDNIFGIGWCRYGVCRRCHPDHCSETYQGGVADTTVYHSVTSSGELITLQKAGIQRLMINQPVDYNRYSIRWQGDIALNYYGDDPDDYLDLVIRDSPYLDFATAPYTRDVDQTRLAWLKTRDRFGTDLNDMPIEMWPKVVPVWRWGTSPKILKLCLQESWLVGIAGLEPIMRTRSKPMLSLLALLCAYHMGRFHLLGCSWPKAAATLNGLAASIDTSLPPKFS